MERLAFGGGATVRKLVAAVLVAAGALLGACGGGGGNSSGGGGGAGDGGGGGTPAVTTGTLAGVATKGPVADATVTAYSVANGARGAQVGTARTDAQGHFTMQVGDYSGPMMLEVKGGTYVDEATNATMPIASGDVLACAIPSFAAGSSETVEVTPLTSMAQAMAQAMPGGMTAGNVEAANADVGSYFSCGDILHTAPMDPLVQGSGATATQEMKNYGMTIAAMSQYAMTLGMTGSSSGMVTAMMQDASDGTMNGMMESTQIAMGGMGGMGGMMGGTTMMPAATGTSELATAMGEFVSSSMNHSGVPLVEMQPLMNKLSSSSGEIR